MSKPIISDIQKIRDEFYASTPTNFFFKKSQKFACAAKVVNEFSLDDLISNTCFIIPNTTNKVFFDYKLFKMYANPSNYQNIISHIATVISSAILPTGNFEFHIDLNTFTMSAAERYFTLIDMFCTMCMTSYPEFTTAIDTFYAYNIPSCIEAIYKLIGNLVPPKMKSNNVLLKKAESTERLTALFLNYTEVSADDPDDSHDA